LNLRVAGLEHERKKFSASKQKKAEATEVPTRWHAFGIAML